MKWRNLTADTGFGGAFDEEFDFLHALAVILGLLLVTQSGCLVVAAAAGTGAGVAYVRGDLETSFDADILRR